MSKLLSVNNIMDVVRQNWFKRITKTASKKVIQRDGKTVRREDLKKYTVGELCDFLEIRGCAEDVVHAVRRNGVNGDVFLE